MNIFSRLTSLFRVNIAILVYGNAKNIPKNIKTILIVPTGKLGDVVCATPILYAVRASLPNAHIIVENNKGINEKLLANSGLVDEYISLSNSTATKIITSKKIDVALFTGPDFYSLAKVYCAGVRCIVTPKITGGWSPYETRPYKYISKFVLTSKYNFSGYAPRERLRVLEPLGIVYEDSTKHLGFSETANLRVESLLASVRIRKNDLYVCMSAGAGNKIKQWPPTRFAEVATYICDNYKLPVIVIGSALDKKETDEMMDAVKNKNVYDFVGKTSLDETKALISHASLFISVDTGPIYIAEAFGIPTIDIVGPVAENEQPPISNKNIVISPPDPRIPQLHIMNTGMYDEAEAIRQVLSITVKQVTSAVDILLT